jgi:hypothetical protein
MNAVGRTTQRSVCRALGSEGPGGSSWRETEAVGIDIPDGIRIPLRMSSGFGAAALGGAVRERQRKRKERVGDGGGGARSAGDRRDRSDRPRERK